MSLHVQVFTNGGGHEKEIFVETKHPLNTSFSMNYDITLFLSVHHFLALFENPLIKSHLWASTLFLCCPSVMWQGLFPLSQNFVISIPT